MRGKPQGCSAMEDKDRTEESALLNAVEKVRKLAVTLVCWIEQQGSRS